MLISVGVIAREYFLRQVDKTRNKTKKKRQIMKLYEHQIITAGDVERLFDKYKLRGA